MPDYRSFRLSKLNQPEFEHMKLLLFWPIFGLAFLVLERFLNLDFKAVYCGLDDYIPFCEYFIIPYYFWFVYLIGMLVYSFFFDVPTFKKYMSFIVITYTITLLIYVIYPTKQELRPPVFERDNIFTAIVGFLYGFDTNTNVCPSMHVIGALAVYFSARKSKLFSGLGWRIAFGVAAALICVSTVFLKQHSIVDVIAGVVLSFAAYPIVFMRRQPAEQKKREYQTA